MNFFRSILLSQLASLPALAAAAGYGPWDFGMTGEEVKAVTAGQPYYDFRNSDIGTRNGTFEGRQAPVSFYFRNDRLVRVMVVAYAGMTTAKRSVRGFEPTRTSSTILAASKFQRGAKARRR